MILGSLMHRRSIVLIAALAVLVLLVAACGDEPTPAAEIVEVEKVVTPTLLPSFAPRDPLEYYRMAEFESAGHVTVI